MADLDPRPGGLLAWQWSLYPGGHTTRLNLTIHVLTVPLFQVGTIALVASPVLGLVFAIAGLLAMVAAMAAQGRGHASETERPARFRGPVDVLARFMAEQWITFPRFVFSGEFARAWRNAPGRPRS